MKQTVKYYFEQIGFMFLITLIIVGFFACDNNIPRPDELTAEYSISVAKFTVDDATLTIGDSTILRWDVEDDEAKVDYVQITPDVGVVATGGTKQITPQKTTLYTLKVFVNNVVVKSQTRQVTVLSAAGDEVEFVPDAEVCTGGEDEDLDGAVDCDDSDCDGDEACKDIPVVYEWIAEPASSHDVAILGVDEVVIKWESTFDKVTIEGSGITSRLEEFGTDDYRPTISETGTYSYTIKGYGDGAIIEEKVVEFEVVEPYVEELVFSAIINQFTVTPGTNLIYGQSYRIAWDVVDADFVTMDEFETSTGNEPFIAGEDSNSHTLYVVDENGLEKTYAKSVSAGQFNSSGTLNSGQIIRLIPGVAAGELYTVTGNAVKKTEEYGSSAEEIVSSSDVSGVIHSFAVSEGKYFIGTTEGMWVKEGETSTQILNTLGYQTYQTIVVTRSGKILAGTEYEIHEIEPSDSEDGYKRKILSVFGGDAVDVKQLFVDAQHTGRLFAVTSKGVYYSDNNGSTFSLKLSADNNIKAGGSHFGADAYVWSDDEVFVWDSSDNSFSKLRDLERRHTTINHVTNHGGRHFVATDAGVYATYESDGNVEVFLTNLTSATDFILPQVNLVSGENTDGGRITGFTLIGFNYKVIAVTDGGAMQTLTWSSMSWGALTNPLIRGIVGGWSN